MNFKDFMKAEVRVYCPICKNGNNAIWAGSLIDWALELNKEVKYAKDVPKWAQYAFRHEKAHGHKIIVKYPDGSSNLLLGDSK